MKNIATRAHEAVTPYLTAEESIRAVAQLHAGSLFMHVLRNQFGILGTLLINALFPGNTIWFGGVTESRLILLPLNPLSRRPKTDQLCTIPLKSVQVKGDSIVFWLREASRAEQLRVMNLAFAGYDPNVFLAAIGTVKEDAPAAEFNILEYLKATGNALDALPLNKQIAFAAWCTEAILSIDEVADCLYLSMEQYFATDPAHAMSRIDMSNNINSAMKAIWSFVLDYQELYKTVINSAYSICKAYSDSAEEEEVEEEEGDSAYNMLITNGAHDLLGSLLVTFSACVDIEKQKIDGAANSTINIINLELWNASVEVEKIMTHPQMQQEIQRQQKMLGYLKVNDVFADNFKRLFRDTPLINVNNLRHLPDVSQLG